MRSKLGAPKAIVATVHKLARIVYHMLKYRVPFEAITPQQENTRYRQQALRQLQNKARQLGMTIIIEPQPESA
ncbi:MAG: hypothetical protein V7K89_28500 [Nostoc sp.]|uniref:hypothetical protein n=1 Tax=Nostoc sp. TaxID=1180 RepID=UPI002FFC7178